MAIIANTNRQVQEREARGYQWVQSGVPPTAATIANLEQTTEIRFGSHRATIEAYSRGYQFFQAGIFGTPSHVVTTDAIAKVEWKTSLSRDILTPDEFASSSPHIPVVGGVFVRQEQPSHPTPRRLFGSRGPDAVPPIIVLPIFASVFVQQEQGQKTGGYQFFQTGIVGVVSHTVTKDAASGIEWETSLSRDILTPDEFASSSPHIPVVGGVFVRQEQPSHPSPRRLFGSRGPNAIQPIFASVFVQQEQGQKTGGYQFFQTGIVGVPSHTVTKDAASGIEWEISLSVGPQTPVEFASNSVHIPVVGGIFVRQEQPSHPSPRRLFGSRGPDTIPPLIVPPIFATVFVRQEQGQKTDGYQFFQTGTPPTGFVGPPQIGSVDWGAHRATIQSISGGYQFFQAGVRGVAPKIVMSDAAAKIEWESSLTESIASSIDWSSISLIQNADANFPISWASSRTADLNAQFQVSSNINADWSIPVDWSATTHIEFVDGNFPIEFLPTQSFACLFSLAWTTGLGRTKGAATEAPQIFRHPYFKQ